MKKLLVCGLDGSGKTTMIKRWKSSEHDPIELVPSTSYMNLEVIEADAGSSNKTLVYDMSGAVSLLS